MGVFKIDAKYCCLLTLEASTKLRGEFFEKIIQNVCYKISTFFFKDSLYHNHMRE